MIFTDRTIIVQKGISSINDTIILYRGDKGVEIRFTLNEGSPFKFGSGATPNIIEKTEAAYGQLIIKRPNDLPAVFSEIAPTNEGKIVFTITAEMIDEITEVGNYTFQIRLLDESRNSRATLPEVVNGIEIREPIATEDVSDTNEVGVAIAGYAVTTGTTETSDVLDENGNYNKTTWFRGDVITPGKLNKIEAGIDAANRKAAIGGTGGQGMTPEQTQQLNTAYQHSQSAHVQASDIPTKTSELNNDSNFVTSTQMADAINDAQLGGETGGGISSTAKTLLISILRSAVFTSDQSANINALNTALSSGGGSDSPTTQYTITNTLDNASTSNNAVLVDANASYIATITVNDGYSLDTITVTMGGADITSSAVSETTITISSVTGNVVITVTTTESGSSSGGGMVTDGLVDYFDFRTATYNNEGSGGSTIISASQGNGILFVWAKNSVSTQDQYGITQANTRAWTYNDTGAMSETKLTDSFTVACYGYVYSSSHFFGTWGTYSNQSATITLQPTYNTSSSTGSVTAEAYKTSDVPSVPGFRSYIMTADADTGIAKIYVGGILAKTYTGSDYSGFVSWYINKVGITDTQTKLTACAIYNRAFTDIEVVDMHDFFTTMEVK